MGKLQRFIQVDSVKASLDRILDASIGLSSLEFIAPNLDLILKLISSVPKVTDCINVKRVFTHAHGVCPKLNNSLMRFLVRCTTILFNPVL